MEHGRRIQRLAHLGLSAILVVLSFAAVLAPAAPAKACSCMPPDAIRTLDEVPAAFVGTVVDIRPIKHPSEWLDVLVVFEVDEWVKGDLGDVVEMASSAYGASCGFELEPGQSSGVFVREIQTPLQGGLCDRIDGDALRSASSGLPEVVVEGGLASMLVLGSFGSVGVIALDADANIVGYGPPSSPEGWWSHSSVCPGGEVMVELVPDRDLFIRDLHTLEIVDSTTLAVEESDRSHTYFNDVVCRDESGSEIILFGSSSEDASTEHDGEVTDGEFSEVGVVYRYTPTGLEKLTAIASGEGGFIEVSDDIAVMTFGVGASSVFAIDLESGDVRVVYEYETGDEPHNGPFIEGFAMSPSGRYVAAMDAYLVDEVGVNYFLTIFDLQSDEPVVARSQMIEAGTVAFIDDETVAYLLSYHAHEEGSDDEIPGEKNGFVQLFDASSLDLVGEWSPWGEGWPTVIDGLFYTIDNGGTMWATDPHSGETRQLSTLPSAEGRIIQLPATVEIAPSATEAPKSFGEAREAAFGEIPTYEGDEADGVAIMQSTAIALSLMVLGAVALWLLFFRKTPVERRDDDA